jgi:hypothetical protein
MHTHMRTKPQMQAHMDTQAPAKAKAKNSVATYYARPCLRGRAAAHMPAKSGPDACSSAECAVPEIADFDTG